MDNKDKIKFIFETVVCDENNSIDACDTVMNIGETRMMLSVKKTGSADHPEFRIRYGDAAGSSYLRAYFTEYEIIDDDGDVLVLLKRTDGNHKKVIGSFTVYRDTVMA